MTTRNTCLCLAALLGLSAGCGTRAYEERLEARIEQLQKTSAYSQMSGAKAIGDTPLQVRLPSVFKVPLHDGGDVDPRRLKPPFISVPGLKAVYEATVTDATGGKLPYYLYLAAEPTSQLGNRDFTRIWRQELVDKLPEISPWNAYQASTPEGRAVLWQRLRAVGPQEFYYVDKAGKSATVKEPGALVIDFRQEGDYMVALIWRLPTSIEPNVKLDELEKLTAGTLVGQAK